MVGGCRTSSEGLTESVLRVVSKNTKVIARPGRALVVLGARSAFHGRHRDWRTGSRRWLCATAVGNQQCRVCCSPELCPVSRQNGPSYYPSREHVGGIGRGGGRNVPSMSRAGCSAGLAGAGR